MSLKVEITGAMSGNGKGPAEIYNPSIEGRGGKAGLLVYNEERLQWKQRTILFTSEDGSRNMNVNGTVSGTPDNIHDGVDNVYWTAVATTGTWDFESTTQFHSGAKSIQAINMSDGDVATISKGSDLAFANFAAVSGWIFITKVNVLNNEFNITFYGSSVQVGTSVNILDYVDSGTLNTWHQYIIPKSDFGILTQTIDELTVSVVRNTGAAPGFYLDDMQIEETSGIKFIAKPATGEVFEFQRVELYFEDALASTLADATMPFLKLDGILGITPTIGFTLQRFENRAPQITVVFKTLSDMMSLTYRTLDYGSDGTKTFLKMVSELSQNSKLIEQNSDRLEITINDDFTGLLNFRAYLVGRELLSKTL
jgi:hypothetical protein